MPRFEYETFIDDDGGDIRVEHKRTERIFYAPDENGLIDESIQGTTKPAPFGRHRRPPFRRSSGYNQRFEVRPLRIATTESRWQNIANGAFVILLCFPVVSIPTEGASHQRAANSHYQRRGSARVVRNRLIVQSGHEVRAGIGIKLLSYGQVIESSFKIASGPCPGRPSLRNIL